MGLFPDPPLKGHLRRVAGLPRRPKVRLVGPTGEPVSSDPTLVRGAPRSL